MAELHIPAQTFHVNNVHTRDALMVRVIGRQRVTDIRTLFLSIKVVYVSSRNTEKNDDVFTKNNTTKEIASGSRLLVHPALRCSVERAALRVWEGRATVIDGHVTVIGGNGLGRLYMECREQLLGPV
jgi:hypothetical protein